MSNKRLSIVSGDAAARSLAASAGLPVVGTGQEYEASLGAPATGDPSGDAASPAATALPAAGVAAAAAEPELTPTAGAPAVPAARKSQRPKRPVPAEPRSVAAIPDVHEDVDADDPRTFDRPRGRSRAPLLAALGLVGLAVIVLAVAGY